MWTDIRTNNNDYIEAEGIAEEVDGARMRCLPIKSEEQLDMQSLHRVREWWVNSRTALVNQIRRLLLEPVREARRHAEALNPACGG